MTLNSQFNTPRNREISQMATLIKMEKVRMNFFCLESKPPQPGSKIMKLFVRGNLEVLISQKVKMVRNASKVIQLDIFSLFLVVLPE